MCTFEKFLTFIISLTANADLRKSHIGYYISKILENTLNQRFPNCAPRDFVRGAAKVCESCCTYCFSHNNCSVKVVSSNFPSENDSD